MQKCVIRLHLFFHELVEYFRRIVLGYVIKDVALD